MNTPFLYGTDERTAFGLVLTGEGLQRCIDAAGNDETTALWLYTRNTALSAAFYGPLQACEVAIRNAVDGVMSHAYGRQWFHNSNILRGNEVRSARQARDAIERAGKTPTPGRTITELGFGFWVGLFANAYDNTLWRMRLSQAFSPKPARHHLFDQLDRLRTLRNRIAHHEPIFQRNLFDDSGRILDVLGRLSKPVAAWVDHHSRVHALLAASPEDVDRF